LLIRYLEGSFNQSLIRRQEEIDEALVGHVLAGTRVAEARLRGGGVPKSLRDAIKLSPLRTRLGLIDESPAPPASQRPDEFHIKLFGDILRKTKDMVHSWNGTLYFVYLPGWNRYAGSAQTADKREPLLAFVKSLHIPVVDIHEVFRSQPDPLSLFPHRRNNHYNVEGHRLVADAVLNVISRDHSSGL
jgi:hypothetical protein